MPYYHWSENEFSLRQMSYLQKKEYKPNGLWFDVDASWLEFCQEEWSTNLPRVKFAYEVEFPEAEILHIQGELELERFTREYSTKFLKVGKRFYPINWPEVAKDYKGILISPYVWAAYGWDIESGCIWDTSILKLTKTSKLDILRKQDV